MRQIVNVTFLLGLIIVLSLGFNIQSVSAEEDIQEEKTIENTVAEESSLQNEIDKQESNKEESVDPAIQEEKNQAIIEDEASIETNDEIEDKETITEADTYEADNEPVQKTDNQQKEQETLSNENEDTQTFAKTLKASTRYAVGDSGPHVKELKEQLVRLGFAKWSNPTEVYGQITANVVKDFQKYYNLQDTGVANLETRNKIIATLNPPYQNGDRGQPVVKLKKDLVKLGYANWSNPSQFYGSVTVNVVKEFQRTNGLTADGIVGSGTLSKIEELLTSRYMKGDSGSHVVELKLDLVQLGFAGWKNPTQFYGTVTANVVKDFQEYYNLEKTGIADLNTRNKMKTILNPPYQSGDRGQAVVKLKEDLVKLGYANWSNPSQFYGSVTVKVVKDFQRDNGLTADGITGSATLDKMKSVLAGIITVGDSGSHVVELKKNLTSLGYANWKNPTPYYGSVTANVVKKFQRAYGLTANGVVDSTTLQKVEDALEGVIRIGDSGTHVVELKRNLTALGYANWKNPSPYYGQITANVVNEFKRDRGLPADGVADKKTIDLINNGIVKVFIDPGHGAHDSGGTGYGMKEKDVVLDIALKLAKELSGYAGVEIMLSRTTDTYKTLGQRTQMANNWGADFFISLHTNALNYSANGFESFIFNGSVSKETRDRQNDIHSHIASWLKSNNGINDRGAKRANFHVLRESNMPGLLLEYMFIDNQKENNLLKSKGYRETLGKITADAIAKSFNLKKK